MRPVMMSILRNWEVHGGLAAEGGYGRGSLLVGLVEELCLRRDRVGGGSRWDVNYYMYDSIWTANNTVLLIDGIEMSVWRSWIIPSASHPSAGSSPPSIKSINQYAVSLN
jgi:hypothetical protein